MNNDNEININDSNCKDEEWVDCVRSSCEHILPGTYNTLPDIFKIDYLPFYSEIVDCNDAKWGGNGEGDPEIRGGNVCGTDNHVPHKGEKELGDCEDDEGLKYTFIDYDVIDGREYTYSLTSYDMGIPSPFLEENYNPDTLFLIRLILTIF